MKATALLLNWRRPDNIHTIISRLRGQSVDVDIFLWNNNAEDQTNYPVDVQINSSQNFFCWPRWLMGSMVESDFIFSMDDDFCFRNKYGVARCAKYMKANNQTDMIGYCGVSLNQHNNYWKSQHFKHPVPGKDLYVDIIKGRFIFTRPQVLRNVNLYHPFTRGDDISISSKVKTKVIPGFLRDVMENLPAGNVGLDKRSPHRQLRKKVCRHYFGQKNR